MTKNERPGAITIETGKYPLEVRPSARDDNDHSHSPGARAGVATTGLLSAGVARHGSIGRILVPGGGSACPHVGVIARIAA